MAELFSQVLDLKKKDVFLETQDNDTIYFSVTGLPSTLSYGKHPFSITFNDPEGEPLLKNLSNIVFEFVDSRGTVIFSNLIDIAELSGAGNGFIWIKKDPLRTADEIADGPAFLYVMGELDGNEIPNEWKGIYNVRTSFTYDIRKDFPNTSPLVLSKPTDIQTNLSVSESIDFDDSDTVFKRSFINVTLSDLETNGGKIESVELAYNEQNAQTDDFEIITDYPLSSGSFETISQTLTSGLNPITNTTKIITPAQFRRDTPVKFRLRFLNPSKQLAQYLDEDRQGEIVEVTSSFITFEGAPTIVEKEDNLLKGSMYTGQAVGKGFEQSGKSSAYLKTVDYEGFQSASLGLASGGVMFFSGSVLTSSGDNYDGVGMEMVANSESFFRFRTNPSELDIRTDKFFIGNETNQFISGSTGNIEISSSLFHLDPKNELLVIGTDAIINADLSVTNIRTPATIGGSPSTEQNASASITAQGFAKFVSASIGGFDVSSAGFTLGSTNVNIDSSNKAITINNSTFGQTGIQLDYNSGTPRAFIGKENGEFFKFDGSSVNISSSAFFLGSSEQFISGSTGNIEISSSLFHLDPSNNTMIISGTVQASDGNIGNFQIIDGRISGSNITFDANNSSIFKTDQGPGSDTSAAFDQLRDEYYIDFTPSSSLDPEGTEYYIKMGRNFMVDKSGILIASGAIFEGTVSASAGFLGGFVIESSSIHSKDYSVSISGSPTTNGFFISSSNFNVKGNGNITGSQVLFTGGKIGGFTIDADEIKSSTNIGLDSNNKKFTINNTTFGNTGIQLEFNGGTPRAHIGKSTGEGINFDGTNVNISSSAFNLGNTDNFISGSNGNLKIFSTGDTTLSGSSVNINTPKFFFGSPSQFISGSNGNIEITSSMFHLDPDNNKVAISGSIIATDGLIGGFTIDADEIKSTNIIIDSNNEKITVGSSNEVRIQGGGTDNFIAMGDKLEGFTDEGSGTEGILIGMDGGNPQAEFVKGDNNYFIFDDGIDIQTDKLVASGSTIELHTPKFFFGSPNQFVSGSNGNIEISSSNFHLDAAGNVDMSGTITATAGVIGGFTIGDDLSSTAGTLKLKGASGQITGSNVLFSGGKIAGFTISGSTLTATNFTLDATGKSITLGDTGTDNVFIADADTGIQLGHNTFASAPFSVTPAGVLKATSGTIGGFTLSSNALTATNFELNPSGKRITLGSSNSIFIADGDEGIQLGHATFSSAPFSVTTAGVLKATSGTVGGFTLSATQITSNNLIIDSAGILQTSDYTTNQKGWRISSEGNGLAEFENVKIRGTVSTAVFEKETINAVGGQLYVANSTTLSGSGQTSASFATMSVANVSGFKENEILSLKKATGSGFSTEYILVQSASLDNGTAGKLFVQRGYGSGDDGDSGSLGGTPANSQSYEPGQVLVSTGITGSGFIRLNANPNDTSTPYMDIVERTGTGVYDVELKTRIGDLSGVAGTRNVPSDFTGFGIMSEVAFLSGSNIKLETPRFLLGDLTSAFVSGSNGNIEISSSAIHLTPEGNITASNALLENVRIVGGAADNVINPFSFTDPGFIGGGKGNQISASLNAFLGGGDRNKISGSDASVIAGGRQNVTDGTGGDASVGTDSFYMAILGGSENEIYDSFGAAIVGGANNTIRSDRPELESGGGAAQSFIGGGGNNTISGSGISAIIGGNNNVIESINPLGSGDFSAIIGGGTGNNIKHGVLSAIMGGANNDILHADRAFLGGGSDNKISGSDAEYSMIVGGQDNTIDHGRHSAILGGQENTVNVAFSSIAGGRHNKIVHPTDNTNSFNFIGGGLGNHISGSSLYCSMLGTQNSKIIASANSNIVGGRENVLVSSNYSLIGSGNENHLSKSLSSVLVGGQSNKIVGYIGGAGIDTIGNFLGGGTSNQALASDFGFIGGGASGSLIGRSNHSVIVGGLSNEISSSKYSAILGGQGNQIIGNNDDIFIVGSNITASVANTTHVENLYSLGNVSGSSTSTGSFGAGYIDTQLGIGEKSPDVGAQIHLYKNSPKILFEDADVAGLKHHIQGGGNAGLEYGVDVNNQAAGYHRWDISNSEKMRLIENGNLGIGDTSADDRLHVKGGGVIVQGSGGSSQITFKDSAGNADGYVYAAGGAIGFMDDDAQYAYKITTDVGHEFSVNNTKIADITSTMAISGSATSTGSFGNADINNQLRLKRKDATGAYGTLQFQSAGFIIDQTAAGYSPLIIKANGTEKARFNNDGNLGLGVTNPTRKIHIDQTSTSAGGLYVYSNAVHTGTTTNSLVSIRSDNTSASGTVLNVHNDGTGTSILLDGEGKQIISGSATSTGSFGRVHVANDVRFGGPDEDGRIGYLAADGFGFDTQHNQLTFITNDQGDTNQAIVLGDTNPNSAGDDYTFFGIAGSTNAGGAWTKLLNLDGLGNLDLSGGVSGSATSTGSFGRVQAGKFYPGTISTNQYISRGNGIELHGASNRNVSIPDSSLILGGTGGATLPVGSVSGSAVGTGSFGSGYFDKTLYVGTKTHTNRALKVHGTSGDISAEISNDATSNAFLRFSTDLDGTHRSGIIGMDYSDNVLRINHGGSFDGVNNGMQIDSSGNVIFAGSINTQDITAYNMITIESADISSGENNGLRLINTSGTDHYWHITNGQTGVSNDNFTIRDGTNNRDVLVLTSAGNATLNNNLTVGGNLLPDGDDDANLGSSSKRWADVFAVQTTTGGVFETGLRTKKIGDNSTGTIVSWDEDGLVPCDKNEDELVMGVIKKGKDEPIVLGAEPVLVTGKVNVGDYIVTSDKIGHGKSVKKGYLLKKNLFGKVIAQALESCDGDSNLIKCMIRKM